MCRDTADIQVFVLHLSLGHTAKRVQNKFGLILYVIIILKKDTTPQQHQIGCGWYGERFPHLNWSMPLHLGLRSPKFLKILAKVLIGYWLQYRLQPVYPISNFQYTVFKNKYHILFLVCHQLLRYAQHPCYLLDILNLYF